MTSHDALSTGHEGSRPVSVGRVLRWLAASPTRLLGQRHRDELRALVAPRWQEHASCASADPEAWFPEKGSIPPPQVLRICAGCPVNRSCLAVALLWGEDGIWAGTNPGQRHTGYRLMRRGVSASAVVELLLTDAKQHGPARRWAGYDAQAAQPDPRTGKPPATREVA